MSDRKKKCLSKLIDETDLDVINTHIYLGMSLIHMLYTLGYYDLVQQLLDKGGDHNVKDRFGMSIDDYKVELTPFHLLRMYVIRHNLLPKDVPIELMISSFSHLLTDGDNGYFIDGKKEGLWKTSDRRRSSYIPGLRGLITYTDLSYYRDGKMGMQISEEYHSKYKTYIRDQHFDDNGDLIEDKSTEYRNLGGDKITESIYEHSFYKNGLREGVREYIQDSSYNVKGGRIIENYTRGQLNGERKIFQFDGYTIVENYKDGSLDGEKKAYLKQPAPIGCILTKSEVYKNGKLDGEKRTFFATGKIATVEQYKDGILDGERREYFANGNYKFIENYINGKLEGERKVFMCKGNLRRTEAYANGKLQSQ